MPESIGDYKKRLSGYSNEELESILISIDKENYPEKYESVLHEIKSRKGSGQWIPAITNGSERYRTLARRFGALLIDGVIFMVITFAVASPFSALDKIKDVHDFPNSLMPYFIKMTLIQLLYVAYVVLFHWRFGATFGKMALGIKVVDYSKEGGISLKQAIVRDIVPSSVVVISSIEIIAFRNATSQLANFANQINSLWSILEIFTALFSSKRRAIHDIIAKTICIKI
jgi:uncharacterized RDD family membrane protein YckC